MTVRYPWPTLVEPPTVRVEDIRVDGTALPSALVDEEHLRIVLDGLGPWEQFECEVSVDPGEESLGEVPGLIGYVIASSRTTATRVPFPLNGRPYVGRVSLQRSEMGRSVTLEAELAARHGGRLRVVGAGLPWTVILDRSAAPVPAGLPPFDTVWVDFTSAEAPDMARRSPGAHAIMDLGASTPRLLLNSAIDGFQNLLHADTAQRERRRLRDLLGTDVARYATSSLFRAATAEIGLLEDRTSFAPETALYRQVCESIAEVMIGVGSVDELYEQMSDAVDTSVDRSEFWARTDIAIDALVGRSSTIEKICGEVKYA